MCVVVVDDVSATVVVAVVLVVFVEDDATAGDFTTAPSSPVSESSSSSEERSASALDKEDGIPAGFVEAEDVDAGAIVVAVAVAAFDVGLSIASPPVGKWLSEQEGRCVVVVSSFSALEEKADDASFYFSIPDKHVVFAFAAVAVVVAR